jgi:hypothetical protein
MIVYLDLNKWIELAKIENGKDKSTRARKILSEFRAARASGVIFPLSSTHYIEFSRISNLGRRKRLGSVMWKYSQGHTLASYGYIVEIEIEVALQKYAPQIVPRKLELIGSGIDFAFGIKLSSHIYQHNSRLMNEYILIGNDKLSINPICSKNLFSQRNNFVSYLESLHERKNGLDKHKQDDLLYALSLADIEDPINRVLNYHRIDPSLLCSMNIEEHRAFIRSMPTTFLDVHLYKQVIKNFNYKAKKSDLED